MSCDTAYLWYETTMIIVSCLLLVGMTAAFVIINLVRLIQWAVPEVIPDKNPPTPPLTPVQKALLQAQKRGDGGWTLREGEEVDDGSM